VLLRLHKRRRPAVHQQEGRPGAAPLSAEGRGADDPVSHRRDLARRRRRWFAAGHCAGVGALTFELLERGFDRAVIVEASAGYTAAATSEDVRRGRSPQVELVSGDFLEVAGTVSTASVVALDRVVCCYPLYEELLIEAIRRAERAFAFSYPRERWYVRVGMKLENALRSRKTGFRTFVHPETKMRELIRRAGFELVFQRRTAVWSADVFVRQA
jgi:hypothetical protein